MRLDEWQKYIGSQFLDDEQETVPAPQKAAATVSPLLDFLPPEESEVPPEALSVAPVATPQPPTNTTPVPIIESVSLTPVLVVEAVELANPAPSFIKEQTPNPEAAIDPQTVPAADKPELVLMDTTGLGARPETTPNAIQNVVTMLVTPPALPDPIVTSAARTPRIELLTPLPNQTLPQSEKDAQPEVSNRTRRRSQSAGFDTHSESITPPAIDENIKQPLVSDTIRQRNLFQPLEDMDADIPSFANYLPASHSTPILSDVSASLPVTATPSPSSICIDENEVSLHSVTTQKELQNAATQQEGTSQDITLERRAPRTRARHARNVRPENVPSGLSAAELWAAVPRHVQTLLSLERLEAEQEVAQFSYKRPFQEKRHELIERLLDPILSLEDTARLLNVCPTTVRRYTNKGILTYYRKEPDRATRSAGESSSSGEKETRQRRFRLSDILAFLETQQTALAADRRAEGQAALLDADFAEDNGKEILI